MCSCKGVGRSGRRMGCPLRLTYMSELVMERYNLNRCRLSLQFSTGASNSFDICTDTCLHASLSLQVPCALWSCMHRHGLDESARRLTSPTHSGATGIHQLMCILHASCVGDVTCSYPWWVHHELEGFRFTNLRTWHDTETLDITS